MTLNMLNTALLVVLLCPWRTQTQDFMAPSTNILHELGKIHSLEERLKTVEEMLQSQNNLMTDLNSKLEELRSENGARKVAFSASLVASGGKHFGPESPVPLPLIYTHVFSNIGNGYDSETGIFKAPLKGAYYLRFSAHCQAGNKLGVSLFKNGSLQCSVFHWRPATNGNGSNGIVLTLEKGDQIYMKVWDDAWVFDNEYRYSTFGGFLLFPL